MSKICWLGIAALGLGSHCANAQVPKRVVRTVPDLTIKQVATPSKLSQSQLLSRLRLVKQPAVSPAPTTSTPSPAPAPTPAPISGSNIVERETLSVDRMKSGGSSLRFYRINLEEVTNQASRVTLSADAYWDVTFSGSGNPYAIDCAVTNQNTEATFSISMVNEDLSLRVIEGSAPLIDNHLVITVPRWIPRKLIRVRFDSPADYFVSTFHSCQIVEIAPS